MNQESAQPKILQRNLQTGDEVARIIYAKKTTKNRYNHSRWINYHTTTRTHVKLLKLPSWQQKFDQFLHKPGNLFKGDKTSHEQFETKDPTWWSFGANSFTSKLNSI